MEVKLNSGKYIIAVSGGVDSVVLLDALSGRKDLELIVAHFDHGIRNESARDRRLVQDVASRYNVPFEYEDGCLGENASEEQAREARYSFLRRVKDKHNADAIITAHHRDDAIETLIINILRGTSRRGVLKETDEIRRPLLNVPKSEILRYAQSHRLKWREDSTNQDVKYLRNYVRQILLPKMIKKDPEVMDKLLHSDATLKSLNEEIDNNMLNLMEGECKMSANQIIIPRTWLIMLPNEVGREIIYEAIRRLDKQSGVSSRNLRDLLVFAKTAKIHKKTHVNANILMYSDPNKIIIELV